jgi:hypothetical protein
MSVTHSFATDWECAWNTINDQPAYTGLWVRFNLETVPFICRFQSKFIKSAYGLQPGNVHFTEPTEGNFPIAGDAILDDPAFLQFSAGFYCIEAFRALRFWHVSIPHSHYVRKTSALNETHL